MNLSVNPPPATSPPLSAFEIYGRPLKFTGSPPHILMHLHGPKIRILLLFWQPLIT